MGRFDLLFDFSTVQIYGYSVLFVIDFSTNFAARLQISYPPRPEVKWKALKVKNLLVLGISPPLPSIDLVVHARGIMIDCHTEFMTKNMKIKY